jgi:hypothetical protein
VRETSPAGTRSLIFISAELVVRNRVVATANGVWKTLGGKRNAEGKPIGGTEAI